MFECGLLIPSSWSMLGKALGNSFWSGLLWKDLVLFVPLQLSPEMITSVLITVTDLENVLGLARTGLIFTGLQEGAQPGGGG